MLVDDSTKIYAGQTEITKAYQGNTVIYEKQVTPPYTELDYIASTGTQYIDTNYKATTNKVRLKMKFRQTLTPGHSPMFGCYINSGYYKTTATLYGGYYYASNYNSTGITYASDFDYDIDFQIEGNASRTGTYSLIVNGSLVGTGNRVGETCKTVKNYLFTQASSGGLDSERAIARIYYLKFYDNDVLVRDFIPVLDENNVPCLYEKVENKFYYNAGSGNFNYGTK